jgi:flagellar basal body-associated protein FliL
VIVALLAVVALATVATAFFVYRLATNVHEALEESADPMPVDDDVEPIVVNVAPCACQRAAEHLKRAVEIHERVNGTRTE